MARQVLENGVILPAEYSDDWYDDMTSNLTKLDDVIGSDSEKLSSSDVGAAALSNNYNDLDNLPTIPTVNDATLTIQKNGVDVQTFTANASSNVTANITVPTKTSDLTNDSNFVDTSNSAVASGITSAKVTAYDSHLADTDIHVTTADKTKWNNGVSQAYVFRYSSTALVASSTNSNTLLDNTDNLKVGDKVIDSDGVLFSITAIDTVNSTFTVGSALVDLALDANVVHTSGNENVAGYKTFSYNMTLYNSSASVNPVALFFKNKKVVMGSTTNIGSQNIAFRDSADTDLSILKTSCESVGNTSFEISVYNKDSNNQTVSGGMLVSQTPANTYITPTTDNAVLFGSTNRRWSKIYGTEYYYGSNNIEFSTKFVTTDTAQTISGVKTFSDNLTIYNSDDTQTPKGLAIRNAQWSMGESGGMTISSIRFLDKDSAIPASIVASKGTSGQSFLQFAVRTKDSQNNTYAEEIYYIIDTSGNVLFRPWHDNTVNLGASAYKWKDVQTNLVNGLEPSSLSLPSGNVSDVIDISSYITALDGTSNSYTVPANGWISIAVVGTAIAIVSSSWSDSRLRASSGDVRMLYPVLKNETLGISVIGTTLAYARFIPCQGNV